MDPFYLSVKILDTENAVKYVAPIRKLTGAPISEIKDKIVNGKDVLFCEYTKGADKLAAFRAFLGGLAESGAKLEITRHIEDYQDIVGFQMLDNMINTHRAIEQEEELEPG